MYPSILWKCALVSNRSQFVLYQRWCSMFFPNAYEIHVNQSFIIKIYHKWKVDHRIELPCLTKAYCVGWKLCVSVFWCGSSVHTLRKAAAKISVSGALWYKIQTRRTAIPEVSWGKKSKCCHSFGFRSIIKQKTVPAYFNRQHHG